VVTSLGADSASAAGVLDRGAGGDARTEPDRELVTILPKRQTRDLPVVTEADVEAESAAPSAAASSGPTAAPVEAPAPEDVPPEAVGAEPQLPDRSTGRRPRTLPPPPGRPVTPATDPGLPPNQVGPRWPAIITGAVALALLTFVIVRAGKRRGRSGAASGSPDAALIAVASDARSATPDAQPAGTAPVDAAPVDAAPMDAGPVDAGPVDAGPVDARPVDAGSTIDAGPDWRTKLVQSRAALADGDAEAALALADEALQIRTSARGLVMRAEALRRLDRPDDALAAANRAIAVTRSYSPAWYVKGQILWSVRRYDEARPVFETYLEMQPTGATASNVRELLGLPQ
jgi:hypothetical protein